MLFDIISIICIFAIICLCAVLSESRRENHMLSVSHYTITDKRIKKSATFAMIADLHNAEFGDKNEDLIKEIKKIAPDAVLIAGDVIVGKKDVRPGVAIDLLQKLGSEFPVYISKGNHEMRTVLYTEQYGDIWECLYEQTKNYVHWLINEEATLASDNIQIVGLDMDAAYYRRFRLQKMETDYLVKLLPTRHQDAYTPGGGFSGRPNRPTIVYSNLIRKTYKKTPILLGGIEASLRRMAHYDYWSDKVKRSVLLDSGADLLMYGMGEHSILEIAEALDSGIDVHDITYVRGTVFKCKDLEELSCEYELLPSYEEITESKETFARSYYQQYIKDISRTLQEKRISCAESAVTASYGRGDGSCIRTAVYEKVASFV